ncbi:MAG: cupin domain-containing protein [Chloroflexi bacterium]|nr:cupin domain-containing protein [Chloroflexota bacterium]
MTNVKEVMGRFPFTPEQKRPTHIKATEYFDFIYPPHSPGYSDLSRIIASTDKLLVGTYQLAPGGSFDPADIHPGDEAYYILDGIVTQQNPVSGQFVQAKKGEALWLPIASWHKAFNFEDEIMRILFFIAPRPWDEHIPPPNFPQGDDMKMYKGKHNERLPKAGTIPSVARLGTTDEIGHWPIEGAEGRQGPRPFYRITEEQKLINVSGWRNPMLVKFFVSNDLLHMGEFSLPAGGTGPRLSEPDTHRGDCVLFVVRGSVTVNLPDTEEAFIIPAEDAMFIPEGVRYQLINFEAHAVKAIFCIAPGL